MRYWDFKGKKGAPKIGGIFSRILLNLPGESEYDILALVLLPVLAYVGLIILMIILSGIEPQPPGGWWDYKPGGDKPYWQV